MKLFVGLDFSLEKTSTCVVSEHGPIVRKAEVASDPDTPGHAGDDARGFAVDRVGPVTEVRALLRDALL